MNRIKYIIIFFLTIVSYQSRSEGKSARSNDYMKVEALTESAKRVRANSNSSLNYLMQAEKIAHKSDDSLTKVLYYLNIGEYWKNVGKFAISLDYLLNALKISEKMNYKEEIAMSLLYLGEFHRANIGEFQRANADFTKPLEFLRRAEAIASSINANDVLAKIYDRYAAIYFEIENRDAVGYPKSPIYGNKALELAKIYKDTLTQISCYNILGAIEANKKNINESIQYLNIALNLAESFKDTIDLILININIAGAYLGNDNYRECVKYSKTAYLQATKMDVKVYVQYSSWMLVKAYTKLKDFEMALKYQQITNEVDGTLFKEDRDNKIYEIQRKYDTEKKQAALERKEFQLKIIIIFAFIIIAVFAFWGGVTFLKNKKLKALNSGLKESRKVISLQNDELSELNMTKDKFFSIIAHDIKNPVFAFTHGSEILYNHFEDFSDAEKKEIIGELKDSSINLSNLLENLLTWSRSQRNIIEYSPCQFDLQYTCNSLIDLLSSQAKTKNIKIFSKIDKSILITADVNMINTIIRNLLSNAIKYSQIGGNIEIFHEENNSTIKLSVKDNGVGMTKEICSKIFDLEKNTSERGTAGEKGTGLGLILCKEFVEKHGGRIWAESKIGRGSVFSFEIPQKIN